ncbi:MULTISPECIES: MFS transporter [Mesorhizobium]|uniref:MFS transporter n=2 Tax=Mesorhizobium TaxID=68287 RepID=A0A1A5JS13_RHILI|nr:MULTISPECIES: MFS transporter [Mesorhizobium]MBE1708220.1 MFS transporter [Mesorhizobium japonicum]MBE1713344.1 MFS transporter [Mesorhizobium japonicum]MUT21026.1 MFS transporter [Mesorhizobium japonicum]MUT26807.1 MFS transporter [Mesorhizobium japonicum]OBP73584.1 MFS transporter [Mesorhizobium loti]
MPTALTRRGIVVLSAACLACLMFGLEISSVPTILPTLEQELHADFRQLQWVMNAYTIAVTTVLMAVGTIADRYGRKRVFLISIAAFGLTSLICGLADDVSTLIVARFLQGLSGGAVLICQLAVLSHEFREGRERAVAWGWWGVIFGVGLGFGPIIGGGIVAASSWEWVFLIHGPAAAVAFVLAWTGVHESKDPEAGKLDLAGIVTLSPSVFCLVFYITQGPDLGFASPVALTILGVSIASFIAFLIAERISKRPMFDFSVFRIRPFSGAIVGSAAMNLSYWPFMIYLPIWFHAGLGYDSISTGLALLAYTLPTLVMPPLAERLSLRYQPGIIIPAGLAVIGVGFILMKFGSAAARPDWLTMLPGCLIAGAGLGITNTPVTNTTTGSVSSDRAGMASGIDMSARMVSLAVNIAVMGFFLAGGVLAHLSTALPDLDASQLRLFADGIAAGNPSPGLADSVVHNALRNGFGWVMLYGGIGVWIMAAISFVSFNARRVQAEVQCPD